MSVARDGDPDAPPLHALLVGIERYPGSQLYPDLQGCAHDVEAMERYLLDVLGVPRARIETMVAGAEGSIGAPPTYRGLTEALRRLEDRCRPGEHALVHYSGHGGRAATAVPGLKGPAGKDECLVPLDIARPETPYLRDIELDLWIRRLVAKEVFVTLVLDCCHAGGVRRKTEPRVRGGRRPDPLSRPLGEGLVARTEWQRTLAAVPGSGDGSRVARFASPGPGSAAGGGFPGVDRRVYRHAGLTGSERDTGRGYALFAACRHWEKAREDVFEGVRPSGALTYFLLRALERLGPEATYRQLHEAVVTGVHRRFRGQTPVFEGEVRALPLGHRRLPRMWGVEVLDVTPPGAPGEPYRLLLPVGRCQGVGEGARFGVYPLAAVRSGEAPATPAVNVDVEEAAAASCRALAPADGPRVRAGDRAVLVAPGAREIRWRVGLPETTSESESKLVTELERRLRAGASPRLAIADTPSTELGLRLWDGRVEVCDPAGVPRAHLPELPLADPGTVDRLWAVLEHLARFESVRALDNGDLTSPLWRMVELRVELGGPETCPLEVAVGDRLRLVVESRSDLPLHVAVLDLQPDWGISQICPRGAGSVLLDPQGRLAVDLRASLPAALDDGTDVLKLLAATEPLDCGWMELPPLAGVGDPRAGTRAGPLKAWRSGLRCGARRSHASAEPVRAWVTAHIELKVVRR